MLLLGAGESGKSTIFKQMRLLYGTERSEEDLRLYGVVARSNIVVAARKLCSHLRSLGLEEELDREAKEMDELEGGDHGGMNCRQAYDELMAYLVDNTAGAAAQDESSGSNGEMTKDWVGQSPRAGLAANNDAKLFLAHHESIRILWQVCVVLCEWTMKPICCRCQLSSTSILSILSLLFNTPLPSPPLLLSIFSVKHNETSLGQTLRSQHHRLPQRLPKRHTPHRLPRLPTLHPRCHHRTRPHHPCSHGEVSHRWH